MKCWTAALAALVATIAVGQAQGSIVSATAALAIQNEGTTNIDVSAGVAAVDGLWSPVDVLAVSPTVTIDYYATGGSLIYFDAISLEFDATGLDLSQLELRAYLEKGTYVYTWWQHYQLLPGLNNPTNQDVAPPGDAIEHPGGILANDTVVGWVDLPFDATSDSDYILSNGNVALTFRLWNWRVDAVELGQVPEPSTLVVWSLLGALGIAAGCRRRRRKA